MSIKHLRKFARLARREQLLLVEATLLLALVRLAILCLPFRWIAPCLGLERAESDAELPPAQAANARQIGWAVVTMARHTFWQSACLAQAIAAQVMLKRRGIPCTMYYGVTKGSEKLMAHAWVRSGGAMITGAQGHTQFVVVLSFA